MKTILNVSLLLSVMLVMTSCTIYRPYGGGHHYDSVGQTQVHDSSRSGDGGGYYDDRDYDGHGGMH